MNQTTPLLRDKLAWDGKKLVVTSDAVIDKIRRQALSASTSKSMQSCAARWVGERLLRNEVEDPFAPAPLGTSAHSIMEDMFDEDVYERGERTLALAEALTIRDSDIMWPDVPAEDDGVRALTRINRRRWIEEVKTAYEGLFVIEDPKTIEVYARELQIDGLTINGVPSNGFIDRVRHGVNKRGKEGLIVEDYKGLAVTTPIPTPAGWTTMGELSKGDIVLGSDGKPTIVVAKSGTHHRKCYEVVFSDGSKVVCDNVHLWEITDTYRNVPKVSETVDADELFRRVSDRAGGRIAIHIPNTAPLELPAAELPIDPWVLGAWLGDGHSKTGSLTVGNEDLADMCEIIERRWGSVVPRVAGASHSVTLSASPVAVAEQVRIPANPDQCEWGHSTAGTCQECDGVVRRARKTAFASLPTVDTRVPGQCSRGHVLRGLSAKSHVCLDCKLIVARHLEAVRGPKTNVPTVETIAAEKPLQGGSLRAKLAKSGLLLNKHIPTAYLRGSYEQRLELLQGLMDTDGSFNAQRGRAVFVTTKRALADGVRELVSSLGVTVQWFEKDYENAVRPDATVFMLEFRPLNFVPFQLERKASAVRLMQASYKRFPKATERSLRRDIVGMNVVDSVPTECIAVDAPNHLYLCGTTMIPTHNTGKVGNTRFGDDHGDQIRIYAAALKEKTGELPVGGTVLYTKFGKARDIDLSPGAMSKTLKTFELSWKRHNRYMESREFPTKVSALCGWCPLINACPVAKEEGKTVSEKVADQMHSATHLGIPALRPGASVAAMVSTEDTVITKHGQEVSFFMPDPFSYGIPDEQMAEVERAAELAAHIYNSGENPIASQDRIHGMNKITEREVYKPYTIEGELNPNSYAAMGVFGTAELAVEALHRGGLPINGTNVKALATTFQHIVCESQEHWTGSTSAADGANSRMRGALRTVLATLPMPFGEDAASWDAWVAAAIRRCKSITAVALHLFTEERTESPWEALAGVTPDSAPAAPAPAPAPKAAVKAAPKAEPAPAAEEAAPAADEAVEAPAEADAPAEAPEPEPRRVVRKAAKAAAPVDDIDFVPDDFAVNDDVFA
ncbi:hypothetical protein GCM10023063_16910 [Arthrobacter methylotrophus]|uniref:PD-(D/E)XK nuclease family protein n=1 Tax=Arthrobacter methylotrophus TaxID=121291 RepID=A0ABV5UNN1_9MICC